MKYDVNVLTSRQEAVGLKQLQLLEGDVTQTVTTWYYFNLPGPAVLKSLSTGADDGSVVLYLI